jgi:ribonuclease HII
MKQKSQEHTAVIAGIDEAGRGAIAGPVVAGACVLVASSWPPHVQIADSKMLSEQEREDAFQFLTKQCPCGIGIVEASVVDAIGILAATENAMQKAVEELSNTVRPTYLLIDGRDHFWFDLPHSSVIRGDQKEQCIAAGSILAKVTRDRLMIDFDTEFPGYGFAKHKGYGTEEHFLMLQKLGVTPLHRRTFLRKLKAEAAPLPLEAFSE